jgi:4-hydroxyphenylpyruvate dioxygenase-like putative hemolysin
MAVTAMKVKSSVESLREIVQDMLVPELKAVKAEITSIHGEIATVRSEMATGFDAVRIEMRLRDEKQTQAIKHLDEKLTESIKHLDEKITESNRNLSENIKQLSDKFDSSVEFRERLAALEAKSARS